MKKLLASFLFLFSQIASATTSPMLWGANQRGLMLEPGFTFGVPSSSTIAVLSGSINPSLTATDGGKGSIYFSSNGGTYVKQDNGSTTNWTLLAVSGGSTPTGPAGGDLSGTYPNPSVATVGGATASNIASTVSTVAASTSSNTPNTLVKRDGSGSIAIQDLTASGTISASNFSGSSSGTNTGDVTLGTANGLSLLGQALSLGLSSTSTTGALSSTDWNTFNGKLSTGLTLGHILVGNASNVATDSGSWALDGGLYWTSNGVGNGGQLSIRDPDQSVVIQGTTYDSVFSLHAEGTADQAEVTFERHSNTATRSGQLFLARTRGTEAVSTIVQNGDDLGRIIALGFNGTDYTTGGEIAFAVDGTPGTINDMPGRIDFHTTPDGGGVPVLNMSIRQNGNVEIVGAVSASNFSGSSSGTNTGDVTLAAFGSVPNSSAASLSGQILTLQPADGTNPGGVSTTTQSFGGNKTFTGTIAASNFSGSSSGTNTGDVTLGTANGLSLAGQVLSLGLSSTSTTGALSSTDWNTFNGKLSTGLTSAHLFVGNGSNVATDTAMSGDVTINNTGVTAIGSNKVTNAQLAQMPTLTLKGNNTGITANALDLTVAQVNTQLGTVVGPASATDTAIALFDGTTGKLVKNSVVTVNGTGNTTGIGTLNASGNVTFSNYSSSRVPYFSTGGLIATDSNFAWDQSTKTLLLNDLWLSNDTVSTRLNDLTVSTQTTGKNIILSPASTGVTTSTSDVVLQNQKSLKLSEGTGGGTNFAAFQAPATLAADYTLTMPTALPASTQALFSSSAGVLSFNTVPTYASTFTDNHIIRADGTTGLQNSNGIIDDSGNLTGTNSIAMGNTTWSNVDSISSTNTFSLTSTNDMTLNSGSGNFNMVAFTGDINAAAAGNTVLAGGGVLSLTGTASGVSLLSDTHLNGNTFFLGASNESSLKYSTNLIANPAVSGTGFLFVGDGTNPNDIEARHLGLGSDAPSTARIMSLTESSSVTSNGIFVNLTHTGSTAAMRSFNVTVTNSGSATSPSATAFFSSTHTVDPTGTVTMLGLQGQASAGVASTHGTKVYEGLRASVADGGFSHTGGTVRAISVHGLSVPAFSGGATVTTWGGLFEDDLQLVSNKKLLLEGSGTVKGDSYLTYTSATPSIDTYLDGTQAWTWTTSLNKSEVKLGTKAGSSTTYAKVGGGLTQNTSSTGNVGAGVDDLQTYSVPANTLATDGDRIHFRAGGTFAANGNNKQLRAVYGSTQMITTGALAFNNGKWNIDCWIIRTGAATQKSSCTFSSSLSTLTTTTDYQTPAETLSGAVTLKLTGEATSNNDIVEEMSFVDYVPAQ